MQDLGCGLRVFRRNPGAVAISLVGLKGDGPRAGLGRPSRLRSTLIGVQAAASLVLVVLAALLTRATISATRVDIGFDARSMGLALAILARTGAGPYHRRPDHVRCGRRRQLSCS